MSNQANLRSLFEALPETESMPKLQEVLGELGSNTNLSDVPTAKVSEEFMTSMSPIIEKKVGDLLPEELDALIGAVRKRVKEVSAATATSDTKEHSDQSKVTARPLMQTYTEQVIDSFKELDFGVIEIYLPKDVTTYELGRFLNIEARDMGIDPVFAETDFNARLFNRISQNQACRATPDKVHRFYIETSATHLSREEQIQSYGRGAPLEAVAIAEAVKALKSDGRESLFISQAGRPAWVRTSTPNFVLEKSRDGVTILPNLDSHTNNGILFASERA